MEGGKTTVEVVREVVREEGRQAFQAGRRGGSQAVLGCDRVAVQLPGLSPSEVKVNCGGRHRAGAEYGAGSSELVVSRC